jgi:tRNA(Ile)-lysidine synthase
MADMAELPAQLAAAWPPSQWRDVHVLAAVSGGADSMALLRALAEVKAASGGAGRLLAGHVNHGLRGVQADDDEAWLRDEAKRLGVPLEVRRYDTAGLAAQQGDGIEAAARSARYQLLTEMAESAGARFVALAHTRDDQAETVLFRLLRGTGLSGLAGMPFTRPLSLAASLVRPLLACRRADVLAYLQGIDQPYCTDATNAELGFARNRIRHELLPYLREHFSSEVVDALGRTAEIASQSQEIIDSLARPLLEMCRCSGPPDAAVALLAGPLAAQPPLMVCEVLRSAWRQAGLGEQAMTRREWMQLARLVQPSDAAALNLPGGMHASREGDMLVVRAMRRT